MRRGSIAGLLMASLAAGAMALPAAAADRQPQIVGGHTAPQGAYPWMTALVHSNTASNFKGQFCGGTLISPTRVLTAAHCVEIEGESPLDVDVVVGAYKLKSNDGTRVDVAGIAAHPQYRTTHDVAILDLANAVSAPTLPVIGPSNAGLAAAGATARAIGWGTQAEDRPAYPNTLREADIQIKPDQECDRIYRAFDAGTEICAGARSRGTCFGDSGGPLVVPDGTGGWIQAGITSRTGRCAGPPPAVYTDAGAFRDFIFNPAPTYKPYTTGKPTLSGQARVGGTLHCNPKPDVGTVTRRGFAWGRREPAPGGGTLLVVVHGAHSATYRPRNADRGRKLQCAYLVGNDSGVDVEVSRFVRVAP